MSLVQQTCHLFRAANKNLVQHTVKRGFLFSWKKGISRDTIAWLQQPIDLSIDGLRRWMRKRQWQDLVDSHRYVLERHEALGPDLATAHFVVARDGAVRVKGIDRWIKKDALGKYHLPTSVQANFNLEAVDASNTSMMYTSFDNFVSLQHLKYLRLSKCPFIDDWCLDRFVQFRDTLLVLDLSECPAVTERGLATLHKLYNLKRLIINDMPNVKNPGLVALMLEEAMPNCVIEGVDYTKGFDEDLTEADTNPAFLTQWQAFALRKEKAKRLAAERDGVLEITMAANEKLKIKSKF